MTDNFDDQLRHRLDALGADVTGTRMAGPDAARRRAAQRSRNQITGSMLAGVAVLAIGVVGVTQDDLFTSPEPAAPTDTETPTVRPTTPDQTDTPDETTDPDPSPDGTTIPDDAFITIEDVLGDLPEDEEAVLPNWTETDATQTPFDCAPAVPDGAEHVYYENDQDGHFMQFIEETDDPVGRLSQLRADLESCVRGFEERDGEQALTRMSQVWAVDGLGDEAWMATYFDEIEEPGDLVETNVVSVRLVRTGNYVTMTISGSPGQDDNANMEPERSVTAAERLCAAVGQDDCAGGVTPRRLDREPIGAIAGWLTVEDVVGITGFDQITEGTEPRGADEDGPSGWPLAYLPLDPATDGATSFDARTYTNPGELDDIVTLDEVIATFPDDAAARAHYEDMLSAVESHTEGGVTAEVTSSAEGSDYELITWRADDTDVDLSFVFGAVVHGNQVAVIQHSISDFEDRDLTPEQLADLLLRAADRMRQVQEGS